MAAAAGTRGRGKHRLEVHNQLYLASVSRADEEAYDQFSEVMNSFLEKRRDEPGFNQQAGNIISFFPQEHRAKPHLGPGTCGPMLRG